MLNNNRGRSNANHNALCKRRRQAQERGRGDKEKLLHTWGISFPRVKFQQGAAHAASTPLTGWNTRARKRLRFILHHSGAAVVPAR